MLLLGHAELSGVRGVWVSCDLCDVILRPAVTFQAELVALWAGQHHLRFSWRLRVEHASAEPGELGHLGPLVVIRRDQAQADPAD